MTTPQIDLADFAAAMANAPGARAPLIVWMVDHHDEFAAMIVKQGVNWASVTEVFARQGFQTARGGTLIPETVRSYWKRARTIVAKQRRASRRVFPVAKPPQAP
jgi:hypothetical protein